METAVISYRVADFLKKFAPFNAVGDEDLLALSSGGRVRFYEPNEYLLWQGEPHRVHVFVIQQGTVSLWDERSAEAALRDVRGAGDLLGIERYNGERSCLHSARSETDVVVYAFPADDFDTLILKYPHAAEYVAAEGRVTPDYQPVATAQRLARAFLHDVASAPATCSATDTVASAAHLLLSAPSGAVVVVDAARRPTAVLTGDTILRWVATGASGAHLPVQALLDSPPVALAPNVSIADGVLALGAEHASALVITDDGTLNGRTQSLVTDRTLRPLFGDDPTSIVRECRTAQSAAALRALNHRARAFILAHLDGASSVDWLTRFAALVDDRILLRLIELTGSHDEAATWCVGGVAGRRESLTMAMPTVLVIGDDAATPAAAAALRHVHDGLIDCGYLVNGTRSMPLDFYATTVTGWSGRYRAWAEDPLGAATHPDPELFDVRIVHGRPERWDEVESAARRALNTRFVHLMANDCLDSLPPLTFFKDAVVDSFGEQASTFRLEFSALRPLVDVGRVFALATRQPFGRSTFERFDTARTMLPEHEEIFREAADTLRVVLWQQGRVGITDGTTGTELPAARLGRHDRQVLKSGFRSIERLVQLTAERDWIPQP